MGGEKVLAAHPFAELLKEIARDLAKKLQSAR